MVIVFFSFFSLCWILYIYSISTLYAVQYDNCKSSPMFISAINGWFQVFLVLDLWFVATNPVIIPSFVLVDSPPSLPKKYAIMCLAARQDSAQGCYSFMCVYFFYIVCLEYNVSLHKLSFLQELVSMYVTWLSMGISYSTFECNF